MSSNFLGQTMDLARMIFLVFSIFILMETSSAHAKEEKELIAEVSSREEVMNWAGYGEQRLSTVVISGKLLCNNPSHHKLHPYPVSGASMGVFCGTSGRTRKSWAKGSTNSYGEFLIDLPSHLHAIPNLEKICLVKVLHLPKSCHCRHAFTGKHKGIKLASIGEGVRTYTTLNIHLMPKPSQHHTRHGPRAKH